MYMTLEDLLEIRDLRIRLARELGKWPSQVYGEYIPFPAPEGWEWVNAAAAGHGVSLHKVGTPWKINKRMWEGDRHEVHAPSIQMDQRDQEEPDPAPPEEPHLRYFGSLTNLVTAVVSKPLTSWQRNQLERWEEAIKRNPPQFDPVLKVGVTKEMSDKLRQLTLICEELSTTRNGARELYRRGVRIVDEE